MRLKKEWKEIKRFLEQDVCLGFYLKLRSIKKIDGVLENWRTSKKDINDFEDVLYDLIENIKNEYYELGFEKCREQVENSLYHLDSCLEE